MVAFEPLRTLGRVIGWGPSPETAKSKSQVPNSDHLNDMKVIEHIETVDANGGEITYSVEQYTGDKNHFRVAWSTGTVSYVVERNTLGQAQRWLLKKHARAGGPLLEFNQPQYERRLTHPKFGRGVLIQKIDDKLVVLFDDGVQREILESYVQFDEEE